MIKEELKKWWKGLTRKKRRQLLMVAEVKRDSDREDNEGPTLEEFSREVDRKYGCDLSRGSNAIGYRSSNKILSER